MANIIWTKPEEWVEETGAHVIFKSPCDCVNAGNLIIGENTYSIVDSMGNVITGVGGSFVSGAMLEFVLDCEQKKAFLLTSKVVQSETFGFKRASVKFSNGMGSVACEGVKTTSAIIAMRNSSGSGGNFYGIGTAWCAANGTINLGLTGTASTTIDVSIWWTK